MRLERLVHAESAKLASPGCPLPRVWVWLEHRVDLKDRPFTYVRLEAELFSAERLDGYRIRIESTGSNPESSCRRAFKALAISAPGAAAGKTGNDRLLSRKSPLLGLRPAALGSPATVASSAR